MIVTRSETIMKNTISKYLDNMNKPGNFCNKTCRTAYMNAMYDYMLSAETKKILLRPQFAKFRVAIMKKCDELYQETYYQQRQNAKGLYLHTDNQLDLLNQYDCLEENLEFMMLFLEAEYGLPLPGMEWKSKYDEEMTWNGVEYIVSKSCIGRGQHTGEWFVYDKETWEEMGTWDGTNVTYYTGNK